MKLSGCFPGWALGGLSNCVSASRKNLRSCSVKPSLDFFEWNVEQPPKRRHRQAAVVNAFPDIERPPWRNSGAADEKIRGWASMVRSAWRTALPGSFELGDELPRCFLNQRAIEVRLNVSESTDRDDDLQQIAAVAGPRKPPTGVVIGVVKEVDRLRTRVEFEPAHIEREDLLVEFPVGRLDRELVPHSAKERVVDQFLRVHVRREYSHLL